MCYKYMFETLRLPNSLSFEYGALKTVLARAPVQNSLRTLLFTKEARYGFNYALLFQDCGSLLSNVRTVIGLPSAGIKLLCNPGPRTRTSWSYSEKWWRAEQESQGQVIFQALARSITSWDLEVDAASLQLITEKNPGGIQKLTLRSIADSSTDPFFSSQDSPFPHILAQLSGLRHLSLQQANHGAVPQGYDPIHPNTLIVSYPFVNSLTSLDLTFGFVPMIGWTSNLLTFAELFPSLQTLRLGDSYDLHPDVIPENLFSFPSLRSLYVRLDSAYVIPCLQLPVVQDLHFAIAGDEWTAMNYLKPDREEPLVTVAGKLARLSTLTDVYFEAEHDASLTYQTIGIFDNVFDPSQTKIHTNFFVGKAEAKFPFAREGRYERSDPDEDHEIEDLEAFDSEVTLYGLLEGAEEVATWVTNRARRLEAGGDVAGAKLLMRSLFETIKLKLQDED
ncbi:hypothetical protein JCM5353_001482 [Sporobolomyces roseus]